MLYWLGGRGARPQPSTARRWRTAAFIAGLATIVVALDSPIDELAEKLLWAHMLQHVLLLLVAPPLLALARPWNRMWRGLPLGLRRRVAHEVTQGRWSDRPAPDGAVPRRSAVPPGCCSRHARRLAHPGRVRRDPALSAGPRAEHALFFGTGLLFWTRVIDSPPWRSPLPDGVRAVYVASAMVVSWLLAIVLAFATSPLYAPYAAEASRPGGITALADQQFAAGVMWVPGLDPVHDCDHLHHLPLAGARACARPGSPRPRARRKPVT